MQPTLYIPHGGGPWPWVAGMRPGHADLEAFLQTVPGLLETPPKALLAVTAHWEAPVPTVSTNPSPGMYYDYSGFPEHTYHVKWGAPGSPAVAARVRELLDEAGIDNAEDARRGFDHGTFVPLAVAWPEARIPTVQLSLVRGLDPAVHLAIGRALRPLRHEGVLIVGSGMSYHNMRGFFDGTGAKASVPFDSWLAESLSADDRDTRLAAWSRAPGARQSHPREEHLLPLMVAAGAGEGDVASLPFRGTVLGTRVLAARFG